MFPGGVSGSSPRLRGTDSCVVNAIPVRRFIPAPAGNRRTAGGCRRGLSVHPRACGEQVQSQHDDVFHTGSSPRLRGTASTTRVVIESARFIPAPAGNSAPRQNRELRPAVHPRACGEQIDEVHLTGSAIGSSPRLRGTALKRERSCCKERFIPAPAGNSHQRS